MSKISLYIYKISKNLLTTVIKNGKIIGYKGVICAKCVIKSTTQVNSPWLYPKG